MSKGGDPFDLSDAVIKEENHVLVRRLASRDGKPCTYWKNFHSSHRQQDGKPGGGLEQAHYWTERENKLIAELWTKNIRQVVQLAEIKRTPNGFSTPITEHIATFDAGLTLEDWLRQRPCYADGKTLSHPFQHAASLLALLRAGLIALREIHLRGFVHLDIKQDNICLPYDPYPFKPGPGAWLNLDFDRLKLIDFAFSTSQDNPLLHPLPILPKGAYQSGLLQEALRQDAQWKPGEPLGVDRLDWRADLFSLGHLIEDIIDRDGLHSPKGLGGVNAFNGIHALVARLKAFDQPGSAPAMPHDDLIADINGLLDGLEDHKAHHSFEVERKAQSASKAARASSERPTPVPPATLSLPTPRRKIPLGYKIAAGLSLVVAGGALLVTLWPKHAPPSLACPTEVEPKILDTFQQAANALWPDVSRHDSEAAQVWQHLRLTLAQTLENPPSPGGAKSKTSALVCLKVMEHLGDLQAESARQAFKENHFKFTSNESLRQWLLKPPAERGQMPKNFALGFENLAALAASGDEIAREDREFFKNQGIKLP